jgi:TfoX/Sxy family transcriptional regulator of competence genes
VNDGTHATAEERFAAIVDALRDKPGVTPPGEGGHSRRGFGSTELKVHGRIFAMLTQGRLVVKLPRERVDALVAAGGGDRFDPRRDGRLMKEWLVVGTALDAQWQELANEALAYVGSRG